MKRSLFFFYLFVFAISIGFSTDICAYEHKQYSFTVVNDYGSVVYYEVKGEGDGLIFTDFKEQDFFLQPGESKEIRFDLFVPFSGRYDLSITITNSKGDTVVHNYEINSLNCHTVDVRLVGDNEFCLGVEKPYTIELNNSGNYVESFDLIVGDYNHSFTLDVGEAKNITLQFMPTSFNNNSIRVLIKGEYIDKAVNLNFNVRDCDSFSYSSSPFHMCEGSTVKKFFTIRNDGVRNDTYYIYTNDSSIEFEPRLISLMPGESRDIVYSIESSCNDYGQRYAIFYIDSNLSGTQAVPISYTIDNCYDYSVDFVFPEIVCQYDTSLIKATVTNKGSKELNFNGVLQVNSLNTSDSFVLYPGMSKNITLVLENVTDYYLNIVFNGSADGRCLSNSLMYKEIVVKRYPECYSAELYVQPRFFDDHTVVRVKNTGLRKNDYVLRLLAYNEVDNKSFSLYPGSERTFILDNLVEIHDEYNISEFTILLEGKGTHLSGTTTYYNNNLIGMIVGNSTEFSFYIGLVVLAVLFVAILRKK